MFPHSNTIYAVHDLRRQEYLQEAARERLAATAIPASRSRLAQLAARGRLHLALNGIGALLTARTMSDRSSPAPQGR